MTILDIYVFWPLLAIFRLSLRELKVLFVLCSVGTGIFMYNLGE
jgi:hypothetical protein